MSSALKVASSMGYSPAMSGMGQSSYPGIAYVGGNDTAFTAQASFNARPHYSHLAQRLDNKNPYWPHLQRENRNHRNAHKGFIAFTFVNSDNGRPNPATAGWSMDRDTVLYVDHLNGMLSKSSDEGDVLRLAEDIRALGIVEEDIKAEPHRAAGSPLNNNLIMSGKKTIPNTGVLPIRAGQRFMWSMPDVDSEGNITNSSADKIMGIEKGLAHLVPVPYIPTAHKGSPEMIYRALQSGGIAKISDMGRIDSFGTFRDAVAILDSLKAIAMLAVKAAADTQPNRDVMSVLEESLGSTTDAFSEKLKNMLLRPSENFMHPNNAPSLMTMQQIRGTGASLMSVSTANKPPVSLLGVRNRSRQISDNDTERNRNRIQLAAFENLYRSIASIETRFRDRIIGLAYTTAAPATDMDVLLTMVGNGSM